MTNEEIPHFECECARCAEYRCYIEWKRKQAAERHSVEYTARLNLLADIRAAVGDPNGKLMQDEIVERCRKLRDTLLFIRDECNWECDFGGGDDRIGPAIEAALDWPNDQAK